jgi:hypothetical protein
MVQHWKYSGTHDQSIAQESHREEQSLLHHFRTLSVVLVEGSFGGSISQMDEGKESLVYDEDPVLFRFISDENK